MDSVASLREKYHTLHQVYSRLSYEDARGEKGRRLFEAIVIIYNELKSIESAVSRNTIGNYHLNIKPHG